MNNEFKPSYINRFKFSRIKSRDIIGAAFIFTSLCLVIVGGKSFITRQEPSIKADTNSETIIIDHNSVDLFDQIPPYYLERAKNMRMLFADRSVGVNINSGIDCLEWPNNNSLHPDTGLRTPSHCRRWDHHDDRYDVDPSVVNWNVPGGLNRDNWYYGTFASSWQSMVSDYISALENGSITLDDGSVTNPQYFTYRFNDLDAFSFQFSYLNIDGGTIANQPGGFVSNNPGDRDDIYDLDRKVQQLYPGKTFIYMTTSLSRADGSREGMLVNEQIRQFVRLNNRVLLDVADIEAHDPNGAPCYDNRDGVQYCTVTGRCENYPNDGFNYPAICQHYTTEIDGGHLGSVSGAKIRIAKAFWVMMARLAGWVPDGTPPSLPTSTPIPGILPTATPTQMVPTPTRVPTATPTSFVPTPTTTSGGAQQVHIGDLDGGASSLTRNNFWYGRVRAYVHNSNHQPVSGAIVRAVLDEDPTIYSCNVSTNNDGFCNINSPLKPASVNSIAFRIVEIVKDGVSYSGYLNHDVDGGTNGTYIVITRQ